MYEEGDKRREAYFFALDADVIYLKYDNGNVIPVTECNPVIHLFLPVDMITRRLRERLFINSDIRIIRLP